MPLCGKDEAFVYVMARRFNDGWGMPCKIGLARNPLRRLSVLATACPFPMALYATLGPIPRDCAGQLEAAFHRTKVDYRLHGEWFHITPKTAMATLAIGMAALMSAQVDHEEFTPDLGLECALDHVWCVEI